MKRRDIKQAQADIRKKRIETLGGFGQRRTQTKKSKKNYSRKSSHSCDPDAGRFFMLVSQCFSSSDSCLWKALFTR